MIKLIIFDMDGVLIDSEDAITLAAMEALRDWGISAEYSDFKQFTGMGENKFIGGVAELHGVPYEIRMKDRAYQIYVDKAEERVTVYPWSKPLACALCDNGYKIAVASAADRVKVECNIRCIGLDISMLSALITGSDVEKHKPAPDVFLKAAQKAGIEPQSCVVIEDAVSGVMAAKAAGMTCIALTTSFDEETLKKAGADYVLSGLDGGLEVIKAI